MLDNDDDKLITIFIKYKDEDLLIFVEKNTTKFMLESSTVLLESSPITSIPVRPCCC